MSVSPTAVLNKMDELGAHHDREMLEWRDLIITKMNSSGMDKLVDHVFMHYLLKFDACRI